MRSLTPPQRQVPSNPQDMAARDLFTAHPAGYTDSFVLFLKATMLFGRVTDYVVRGNLRARAPPSASPCPSSLCVTPGPAGIMLSRQRAPVPDPVPDPDPD